MYPISRYWDLMYIRAILHMARFPITTKAKHFDFARILFTHSFPSTGLRNDSMTVVGLQHRHGSRSPPRSVVV
ncbi:hypothetical protein CY34DRAFT_662217 [Suillus luteus UH-Slu-Lm8-n1]|uniref:Unplaced genomic scaffold CY34scaffold_688, whole genome shotgun sequence n=1 Tax=Suillus luteus UH-Slu-Lm8-n1 TaxID=930992 RepID=A0A0C9Z998_9AGAM|nr:hypothetical protein CY34DRAFT_662217 [Suillus luteus UH-Slu-Lm8-n1]